MSEALTICRYCGTGCSMRLSVQANQITDINPDPTHPVSEGELCLKGLYGFKHVADPGRLTTPLMNAVARDPAVPGRILLSAVAPRREVEIIYKRLREGLRLDTYTHL